MRIEKLRLRGFIGIQKGLGLEEISLDFSGISGLVAFSGMNGTGKSSVLENMHAYNQLASRDGALYKHCFLRNSEKELSFTYAGDTYRTLLKIDSDSGKSEGFAWKNGHSEVNGKISEYATYIKNLLGSPALFFASVFCAQNSKKLSDLTTGQLKGLFAEFLRLDRLTEYENAAKQCGNVLSGSVCQLDSRIKHLNEQLSGVDTLQQETDRCSDSIKNLESRKAALSHQLSILQRHIEDFKKVAAQNTVHMQRRQDLLNSIDQAKSQMQTEREDIEKTLAALKAEYVEIKTAVALLTETLNQRDAIMGAAEKENELTALIDELTAELENLAKQGTDGAEKIHSIENSIHEHRAHIEALNNSETLREIKDEIRETEKQIREAGQTIRDIEAGFGIPGLESEIMHLQQTANVLDLKDPECQSKTCAFITNALEAAEKLPGLNKELAAARVKQAEQKAAARIVLDGLNERFQDLTAREIERISYIEEEKGKISADIFAAETAIQAEKQGLKTLNDEIYFKKAMLFAAREDRRAQKALAAKLPQVQVAEERNADLERRMQEIVEKGQSIKSVLDIRNIEATKHITELQNTIETINRKIDPQVDEKIRIAMDEKTKTETKYLPGLEQELQEAWGTLARLQGEKARLEDVDRELSMAMTERGRFSREISEWTYLRNACSKNGLQALEIDGAAPLITGYANDLLAQAFGPLYTVRLRTQDDEGREVLDIVTIGEDGGEVLLENLSGGQRVWVLMALRLAMTLLSKEKSGRNFETAFFDELDGALDPDNAVNFISMYQSFMKTGGFKIIPFISHKTECRNMADNVLHFEYGKNPAWV